MISAVDLAPYRLPLRRPWRSARGEMGERRGWLVRCGADGRTGYGDCAPLPVAGTEEPAAALVWLNAWRARALGRPVDLALADLAGDTGPAPAARYAAECALADLAAQAAGLPLAIWLAPGADLAVPVNAALGPLAELTRQDLAAAPGYRVYKVKLGLGDLGAELAHLADLAEALPRGSAFRLDANGAWDLAEARRALTVLNGLPVESLEEPLGDPTPEALARLQAEAAFPLALDESLVRPGPAWDPSWDPAELPVRRLVLKPHALGGLGRTLDLARRAQAAGLEVVVTSLIESAAGLWPTLHLAAAIASPIPQGLATADWLGRDLGEAPRAEGGYIRVSPTPGTGFRPY